MTQHVCKVLWRGPGETPVCTRTDHYFQPAVAPAPKATR